MRVRQLKKSLRLQKTSALPLRHRRPLGDGHDTVVAAFSGKLETKREGRITEPCSTVRGWLGYYRTNLFFLGKKRKFYGMVSLFIVPFRWPQILAALHFEFESWFKEMLEDSLIVPICTMIIPVLLTNGSTSQILRPASQPVCRVHIGRSTRTEDGLIVAASSPGPLRLQCLIPPKPRSICSFHVH